MVEKVIETNLMVKSYEGQRVLDEISVSLEAGQVHCIVGENGSGKSTFLRTLIGAESVDSGSCKLFGSSSQPLTPEIRAKIGYISTEVGLPNHLSIEQLIKLQTSSFPDWSHTFFDKVFSSMSINIQSYPHQLSSGEQLIVNAALVLAQQPELIILDEPTNGLDVRSQQVLFDTLLLNDIFEESTILFSTHRLDEVKKLADNILVLNQGKIVASGSADEIMKQISTWQFNFSNPDLITQSVKGICLLKQVDKSIFLSVKNSTANIEKQLLEIGAKNLRVLPANLTRAIESLTNNAGFTLDSWRKK